MLNGDGYHVFVRSLRFYFVESGYDPNIAGHEMDRLPESGFLSFWRTPTLTDNVLNGLVVFKDDE